MPLGNVHPITDVCVLVEDIERAVEFYTEKLGFKLRRRAEGFADFAGAGLTLAAWEIDHIHAYTGVSNLRSRAGAHKACIALQLESPAVLDDVYNKLAERGVEFQAPPKSYVWNAYAAYFTDQDDTLWELYAWEEGGPGDYHESYEEG